MLEDIRSAISDLAAGEDDDAAQTIRAVLAELEDGAPIPILNAPDLERLLEQLLDRL